MKILLLTNTLAPDSGWGRYAKETMEALQKEGHEITVFSQLPSPLSDKKNFLLFPVWAWQAWWKGATKNVNAIHVIVEPYAPLAWMLSMITRLPYFITIHGTLGIKPLSHPLYGKIHTTALRGAARVFCVSTYTQNVMEKVVPRAHSQVIHSGASPLPEISLEYMQRLQNEFNIPPNASPFLLTVGAIKERKGQLYTTEAVAMLKQKYPNIFYAIVGDDSDTGYIEKIKMSIRTNGLQNNVRIINNAKNDTELSFFYSLSDIFLLNSVNHGSHFEGFGLVVLEANQFGTPAIGSRGCGIEDAIQDGVNGYLSEQKDPADIREKIEKLLMSPIPLESIRNFYARFDWQKSVRTFVEAYRGNSELSRDR